MRTRLPIIGCMVCNVQVTSHCWWMLLNCFWVWPNFQWMLLNCSQRRPSLPNPPPPSAPSTHLLSTPYNKTISQDHT